MKVRLEKKNKIFWRFLYAYIIMIIISTIVVLPIFIMIRKESMDSLYKYNMAVLEQFNYIIGAKTNEINILAEQLSDMGIVNSAENANPIESSIALREVKERTGIISEIYIYFKKKDVIISSAGPISKKEFYDVLSDDTHESMDDFYKQITNNVYYKSFFSKEFNTQENKKLVYAQSLPVGNYTYTDATMFILLDVNSISEIIKKVGITINSDLIISDKYGDVLFSTARGEYNVSNIISKINKQNGIVKLKNADKFLIYYKDQQNSWNYMNIIPSNEFMKSIYNMGINLLIIWAICIFFGIIFAGFLLRITYRPIREVVQKISLDSEDMYHMDEMELINKKIINLEAQNRKIESSMDRQVKCIFNKVMTSIFNNSFDVDEVDEFLKAIELSFIYNYFTIAVIETDEEIQEQKEYNLILFVVSNVMTELIGGQYPCYINPIDNNRIAVIINIPEVGEDLHDKISDSVKKNCETLYCLLKNEFGISIKAGISSIQYKFENIRICYLEAMRALKYADNEEYNIIKQSDIANMKSSRFIDDIKDYIDNHYNENDISTASVAEKFGITSQYLSTIFKKATGENLYGYITKLRIEKAKKLMNNKNFTIVQIAEKVGYTSDISFIRAFKKTEGITPGKYREGENDE